jgi:hypothetical protein
MLASGQFSSTIPVLEQEIASAWSITRVHRSMDLSVVNAPFPHAEFSLSLLRRK